MISDSFPMWIIFSIIISILGVFHPKTLGLYLIFALFLSALQLFNLGSSWFFFSMMVLFLSGLMVLFLFMASFNNFERVFLEMNSFLSIYIWIYSLVLILMMMYSSNNFYIFIFKVFSISTLFSSMSGFSLFLVCNMIFLVLTVSVKFISLYNAPLKSG